MSKSINVSQIPPEERVSSIFKAFDQLQVGEAIEVISDHNTKGLIGMFERERPYAFNCSYTIKGPDVWKMNIKKTEDFKETDEDEGCCGCCGGH